MRTLIHRCVAVMFVAIAAAAILAGQTDVEALKAKAEQGDASAQFNLGIMYGHGRGVPQDNAEAVKWFRMAAEQGVARAQFNLGLMYNKGEGVPQDHVEAGRWYRLAAEQGNTAAQYNLGVMYNTGEGVPQDSAEAAKWFRMVAEQGDATAQYYLGIMYYNGRGVPQDYGGGAPPRERRTFRRLDNRKDGRYDVGHLRELLRGFAAADLLRPGVRFLLFFPDTHSVFSGSPSSRVNQTHAWTHPSPVEPSGRCSVRVYQERPRNAQRC